MKNTLTLLNTLIIGCAAIVWTGTGESSDPVLADLFASHDAGQAFRSDAYFALLRNYRRHGWIVLYLFGNSPAICPISMASTASVR